MNIQYYNIILGFGKRLRLCVCGGSDQFCTFGRNMPNAVEASDKKVLSFNSIEKGIVV